MIIYKAENIITNEIYIGMTKKRLCERKRDHVYEAFKRNLKDKFHSALRQFGLLSFNWTVLFETNSYKILASKEIEYIDKYKSIEYGYNTQYRNDYSACKRINKINYRNGFVH